MTKNAFTLIELLIVVSVIAVLSGVMFSVININRQKAIANDGVREANLSQAISGLNIFNSVEGRFPANNTGNPLSTGGDSVLLRNYLNTWPTTVGGTYYYKLFSNNVACVSVEMATQASPQRYFKYVSGGTNTCTGRVMKNCSTSCNEASVSFTNCRQLDEVICT